MADNAFQNIDYGRRSTVDWAKFTEKLSGAISKVGTDREKAVEENEKIYSDSIAKLNQASNREGQSLNKFVIDGAGQVKEKMLELKRKYYNKEISNPEWKAISTAYVENFSNLAEQVKTADDRFKLYQDRSKPNADGVVEGSNAESFLMNEYLKMADLNNKKLVAGTDGSLYMQQLDASGNQIGELINYKDFSRPENLIINKVDLPSAVNDLIGEWATIDKWKNLGRGGEETKTSARFQADFDLMKLNTAEALTSNPRMALSILVDNGAISSPVYYTSESEKDALLKEKLATEEVKYQTANKPFTDDDKKKIEMSFIKFEKNPSTGVFEPALSKDQIDAANKRVDQQIEIGLETKINASAPQPYSSSGGGAGDNKDSGYATYASVADAWKSGNMNKLNNMNQDGYYFQWDKEANKGKGAIHVKKIEYEKDEDGNSKKVYRYVSTANSARELSRYFWRESTTVQAEQRFDDEKRAAIAAGVGPDSSNTDINTSGY
jgi:hypothetical protein